MFAGRMTVQGRRFARRVPMEPQFAELLPEVLLGLGAAEFAAIAARALAPRPVPEVSTEHLHSPMTTVREQADLMASRLRRLGPGDVPPPVRGLLGDLRGRGPLPGAARAVPGR